MDFSQDIVIVAARVLPLLVYPLGLGALLILAGLLLRHYVAWQTAILILAFALLWLGGNSWVATGLAKSLEWQYLPPQSFPATEVIVVLGGGTRAQEYPRQITELSDAGDRLLYATWLYKLNVAPQILVTGGAIEWLGGTVTEAEGMGQILEIMGVLPGAIWYESASRNTYENAVNTRKILRERGINQIILVTSALHMPRAVRIFEDQGFDVIAAPTDFHVTEAGWQSARGDFNWRLLLVDLLPSADHLKLTSDALHEYLGLIVYEFR